MVTGCVSSMVMLWDVETMNYINKIEHNTDDQKNFLNTINTLCFQNNSDLFLCGTRDGCLRIYDPRATSSSI